MTDHALVGVLVSDTLALYECSCGMVGQAGRAFPSEDLDAKVRTNHAAHAARCRNPYRHPRRGPRGGLLDMIREDQERRMTVSETPNETKARHTSGFHRGSTFPDETFASASSTGVRQTWVYLMCEAMRLDPGVWFERVFHLEGKSPANPRAAKDVASTFNTAATKSREPAKKNEASQIKFLRKNGGHFEAQHTPNPVQTKDGPAMVLRVRYFPKDSNRNQLS